jgi:hypothetical protein
MPHHSQAHAEGDLLRLAVRGIIILLSYADQVIYGNKRVFDDFHVFLLLRKEDRTLFHILGKVSEITK